jgi:HPr kinase/phosphorylase
VTGQPSGPILLHATAVAWAGRGLLILGPSGSGKSALALQLMALGCDLVSDDQTLVTVRDGQMWARAPDAIRGRIEARGVGLLAAAPVVAPIVLAADLGIDEDQRLPPERWREIGGVRLPVVHNVRQGHFPAALMQYLKAGRVA